MKKRAFAVLLVLCMLLSFTSCGKGDKKDTTKETSKKATEVPKDKDAAKKDTTKETATGKYDTLVIGTSALNGVFSPLFSSSAYDNEIINLVFANISRLDKDGELIDCAGHVEAEEQKAADGHTQVLYTVSVKEGMKFSDGKPVTIDDVLFMYYVYADPTYDGSSTFSTLDIVGMKEYYYDTPDYTKKIDDIKKLAETKYALSNISEEDYKAYLRDTKLAGWWEGIDSYDWVTYLKDNGYDPTGIEKDEAKLFELLVTCEYEKYASAYDPQTFYQNKLEDEFITGNLKDGIDVPEISGITRVNDYSCTLLFNSINITGDRQVAWQAIVPKHYYGSDFKKGELSKMKEKNGTPVGSGPYKYVSYKDNVVSLEANSLYFDETAKIPKVKFQVIDDADKVEALNGDQIDITAPNASQDVIDSMDASGNSYSLVDNPGYGYIAISSERVPDLNVRKGLMHLMNRYPAVEAYYGDLAEVIQRPMTPTVAEYPDAATEVYAYDPAKALECFAAAGYAKDSSGNLVKNKEKLKITIGIAGEGKMDHPSAPILSQMANDLKEMGAELIIQDVEGSVLFNMKDAGELDMWVAAWGNATDCDLTQLFGSKGNDNDVKLFSDEIDNLQAEILRTVDFNKRCELVAKELDLIMEAAVYMPVYQRKNMEIYNASTVKLETLPEQTTTYWNYSNEINTLEMQ